MPLCRASCSNVSCCGGTTCSAAQSARGAHVGQWQHPTERMWRAVPCAGASSTKRGPSAWFGGRQARRRPGGSAPPRHDKRGLEVVTSHPRGAQLCRRKQATPADVQRPAAAAASGGSRQHLPRVAGATRGCHSPAPPPHTCSQTFAPTRPGSPARRWSNPPGCGSGGTGVRADQGSAGWPGSCGGHRTTRPLARQLVRPAMPAPWAHSSVQCSSSTATLASARATSRPANRW